MSKRITARTTDEPGGTVQAGAQRKRRSLECAAQHASEAHHASSSKRSAAIAAAARRWPRPAASDQPMHKEVPPALRTLPQPPEQPCSLSAVQLRACANGGDKSSIFAARMGYGRQGERGARAHTVVWSVAGMSRMVELAAPHEDRRARAPHPDKWATAPSQQQVGCTLRSPSRRCAFDSSALLRH